MKSRILFARSLAVTGLLAATLVGMRTANAQAIAEYRFPTVNLTEVGPGYQSTDTEVNSVATDIMDTSGFITMQINSTADVPNSPFLRVDPDGNATSPATATSDATQTYFSFTVNALAGFELDLTSLNFDVTKGGASAPRGYVVRSSVDAFTTDLAAAEVTTIRPTFTNVNVDLTSNPSFTNLSSVTFRIYSYSPNDGNTVEYDNIVLNGDVVSVLAPEPSTLAMLAVGGALVGGVTLRRRNRSK